jgi:peptidoglycan/LPS O-acetylase OafA/YrhL
MSRAVDSVQSTAVADISCAPAIKPTVSKASGTEAKKYDYIDALRGWAFIGVLVIHVGLYTNSVSVESYTRLGMFGVQLFFVASALTLCLSWQARSLKELHPVRNFFVRRFFRIAPMFWIAILAYRFLPNDYVGPVGWDHILVTTAFIHGWHPSTINSVVPGGWSIAVEMTFYCLFPILQRHTSSFVSAGWWLLGSIGVAVGGNALVWHLFSYWGAADASERISTFIYFWFPSQLPVFLIGFLTYQTLLLIRDYRPRREVGLLLVTWSILLMFSLKDFTLAKFLPRHIVYGFSFGLLILGLSIHPVKVLVNPITCYLGKVSFSAYLVHFAILHWTWHRLSDANFWKNPLASDLVHVGIAALIALLGTVVISTITYRLIELPGIRLGRTLLRVWEGDSRPS